MRVIWSVVLAMGCSTGSTSGTDVAAAADTTPAATDTAPPVDDVPAADSPAPPPPPPCDDSQPDPAKHTAGTCSNLGPICSDYCDVAVKALKPGVAYDTITCQATACAEKCAITEQCFSENVKCMVEALAAACPDSAADAECLEIAPLCAGGEACHARLDGMNAVARSAMVDCAKAGCDDGLEGCVREVLTP